MGFLDFFRVKREKCDETTRLTITVPKTTDDAIKALASDQKVTKSQATKDLLTKGMTVEALAQKGGVIIYRAPEGRETPLYRKSITNIEDPIVALEAVSEEYYRAQPQNGRITAKSSDHNGSKLTEIEIIDDIAAF